MMKMDQMYGFSVNLMIGDNSHTPNFILKDEKQKGEKMIEPDVLSLLISGHYSDWFFNVFMTNIALAMKNNLALLLFFSYYFVKFSRLTKNQWDDKLADWFRNKLIRKKENGGVIPIKPKQEGESK